METSKLRRYQFCDGVKLFGGREIVLGRLDTTGESFKNYVSSGWMKKTSESSALAIQKERKHLFCKLFMGAKWQ